MAAFVVKYLERLSVRPRFRSLAVVTVGLAIVVATHPFWLRAMAELLVVADPPRSADAIVVLAGNSPERATHAIELYRTGIAPRVIVSDEPVRTHAFASTWSELHRRGIANLPIPDRALMVLPISQSTYEEALRTRDALEQEGLHSIVLVTDAFHSRRALMVFRHVFREADLDVHVSPSQFPALWTRYWWHDEDRTWEVVTEYFKLGYYALQGRLF